MTIEERQTKSFKIAQKVCQMAEFRDANKILLFASYKSEVDTTSIFEEAQRLDKIIYYPKVMGTEMVFYQVKEKSDLLEGYRGIMEPLVNQEKQFSPMEEDKIFVLMPGAVFDAERKRIGYGGGYYDKFLQEVEFSLKKKVCKVAVAFSCQIVSEGNIILEEHDIQPDYVITEL